MMHATNINHEHIPANSELSQALIGRVAAIENTADLIANVEASFEAVSYSHDMASDTATGQLVGNALWNIRPGQFEWYLSDIYTQTIIDPLASSTPTNQQNVNAFSTGPNYYIRINNRSNIEVEGRLENYAYENADTDNDRLFAASRLSYSFNSATNANLNYEKSNVTYDNELINTSFDRNDVFLGITYQRNVNTIETQAGYTNIKNNAASDRKESRYLLAFQNQRTRTSTIRVEHNRELSDTSNDVLGITDTGESIITVSSDLYVRTSTSLGVTKILSSGLLTASMRKSETDYLVANDLDQSGKNASINVLWNIHSRSGFAVDASVTESAYILTDRVDEDYIYGVSYSYDAGRNVNYEIRTEQTERKSTDDLQDYDDTRIMLTLEYTSR